MMTSIIEYLAKIRKHGNVPVNIGHVKIGRTDYAAGLFLSTPERQERIVLIPIDTTGPVLPASYRRTTNVAYVIDGREWYISGWHETNRLVWLHELPDSIKRFGCQRMHTDSHWTESFETAMALAGSEVRMRIFSE
jgi:hypothetical protein